MFIDEKYNVTFNKKELGKLLNATEDEIIRIRQDVDLYKSERSPLGISIKLQKQGIFIHSSSVYNVLKRNKLNREFKDRR